MMLKSIPSLAYCNHASLTGRLSLSRSYALKNSSTFDEATLKSARQWIADFRGLPSNIYDISFSRSSGPGGQHVNKTNSKATLKLPLSSLLERIPEPLHAAVRQSPFCTSKSDSIVISSDESRKQHDNVQACEAKLHSLIMEAGRSAVPGETSDETKRKVHGMEKAANEKRMREKKSHASKKSARKGGGSNDY